MEFRSEFRKSQIGGSVPSLHPPTRIPEQRKKLPWDIFKGKIEMTGDFDAPLDQFKDYV